MSDAHACPGYSCDRPECMRRQRDELRERCEKLREALQELVRCDEIVKHGQHERGEKVKGGRWAKAWDRARAALKDALAEKEGK